MSAPLSYGSRPRPKTRSQWSTLWSDTLTIFWGDWLDLRIRVAQVLA